MKEKFLNWIFKFILGILFILPYYSYSQDKNDSLGKALIYFEEKGVVIYLDAQKILPSKTPRQLKAGNHMVQVWAPKRKLTIDTLKITTNKLSLYAKRLNYSDEYLQYREQLGQYRVNKEFLRMPYHIGLLTIAVGAAWFLENRKLMNDNYLQANEQKNLYENTVTFVPSELDEYKLNYDNFKSKYEKYRAINNTLAVTSSVLIPATIAWAVISEKIIRKKFVKPVYEEKPLLTNIKVNYDVSICRGVLNAGISLKCNF